MDYHRLTGKVLQQVVQLLGIVELGRIGPGGGQAAREAGALGAKMTGAGGGGCMLALAPKREEAERLCGVLGPNSFVAEVSV